MRKKKFVSVLKNLLSVADEEGGGCERIKKMENKI
jgi:hypothetical protein